jgi:cytochrome c peroxidase
VTRDPFNGVGSFSDDPTGEADAKVSYLLLNGHVVREFKTPSLRNARLTAPYMHDGRFDSLDDVVDFYSTLDGAARRRLDERVLLPAGLNEREKENLIEFLESLVSTKLPRELLSPPPTPYLAD